MTGIMLFSPRDFQLTSNKYQWDLVNLGLGAQFIEPKKCYLVMQRYDTDNAGAPKSQLFR